jgi:fibro-slime domain-containing protein
MQYGRAWALAFLCLSASCGSNPSIERGTGGSSTGAGGSGAQDAGRGNSSGTIGFEVGGTGGPDMGGGGAGPEDTTGCGDGKLQKASLGEVCDDGNSESGDGCSADCLTVEQNFSCLVPGKPCESTVECGDGKVSGAETCDDGNAEALDGCADDCQLETGWICAAPDEPCQAERCGDGVIAGVEQCEDDDATPTSGDGCSASCAVEPGFVCEAAGEACRKAKCGDGVVEGGEPCDDKNDVVGDGCSPGCQAEPVCDRPTDADGCSSRCGDGLLLKGDAEDCDDGNKRDGDGCSAECKAEAGYSCKIETGMLPPTLSIPFVFRDFVALRSAAGTIPRHPDFQARCTAGVANGMVSATLDADGKPVNSGTCNLLPACTVNVGPFTGNPTTCDALESCPAGFDACDQLHAHEPLASHPNDDPFDFWYRTTDDVNHAKVVPTTLTLTAGAYRFNSTALYPFDDDGWVKSGDEIASAGHNYGFTSEVRRWFEFNGGELLTFDGDDDVWVFINGKLALDLGGVHESLVGTIRLNANGTVDCKMGEPGDFDALLDCAIPQRNLGLVVGKVYEIALFHAERHTVASNFRLALTGFVEAKSKCSAVCGDGTQTPGEACDDGDDNDDDAYGGCTTKCRRGPRCGDGMVQPDEEACDDGANITPYTTDGEGCAPGCVPPAACGDAQVDSLFGEACDDGVNDGAYGGCESDCTLAPRCGDGTIDKSRETCDDGNSVSGDGCSALCAIEEPK